MDRLFLAALPLLVMTAMTLVGLELTVADLRAILRTPFRLASLLALQALLLPLVGAGVVTLLDPPAAIAGGLLLVACSPQATVSNYFSLLGRANVALSVSLTTASSVLALLVTPVTANLAFGTLLRGGDAITLPAGQVMLQIAVGLVLPIGIGMAIRHRAPGFVQRWAGRLRRLSVVLLVTLLAGVTVSQAMAIRDQLALIVAAAVLFTVAGVAVGVVAGGLQRAGRADLLTLAVAFPARSLSVATLVAVNVLGRLEFLNFAVVFFVVQALLLVPVLVLARPAPAPA